VELGPPSESDRLLVSLVVGSAWVLGYKADCDSPSLVECDRRGGEGQDDDLESHFDGFWRWSLVEADEEKREDWALERLYMGERLIS
jgi:hypothetical protein